MARSALEKRQWATHELREPRCLGFEAAIHSGFYVSVLDQGSNELHSFQIAVQYGSVPFCGVAEIADSVTEVMRGHSAVLLRDSPMFRSDSMKIGDVACYPNQMRRPQGNG